MPRSASPRGHSRRWRVSLKASALAANTAPAPLPSEVADPRHRGFYSSFQYVTLIGGQLTAIIVIAAAAKGVSDAGELRAWGWADSVVIGAFLAFSPR